MCAPSSGIMITAFFRHAGVGVIYGESTWQARAAVGHLLVHSLQDAGAIQGRRDSAYLQEPVRPRELGIRSRNGTEVIRAAPR